MAHSVVVSNNSNMLGSLMGRALDLRLHGREFI